jgi:hypothetical protein
MTTETPATPLVDATIVRHHLTEADLTQRAAARTLRIDERTMRRYCSGHLSVPPYVILALMQVAQMRRHSETVAMLDAGKLSTSDGTLTKEQLLENNAKLRSTVEFLLGRASQLESEHVSAAQ